MVILENETEKATGDEQNKKSEFEDGNGENSSVSANSGK